MPAGTRAPAPGAAGSITGPPSATALGRPAEPGGGDGESSPSPTCPVVTPDMTSRASSAPRTSNSATQCARGSAGAPEGGGRGLAHSPVGDAVGLPGLDPADDDLLSLLALLRGSGDGDERGVTVFAVARAFACALGPFVALGVGTDPAGADGADGVE